MYRLVALLYDIPILLVVLFLLNKQVIKISGNTMEVTIPIGSSPTSVPAPTSLPTPHPTPTPAASAAATPCPTSSGSGVSVTIKSQAIANGKTVTKDTTQCGNGSQSTSLKNEGASIQQKIQVGP